MDRKNFVRRAIAGFLTLCMSLSLLPTSALAAGADAAAAEEAAIRQTLLESVDAEEYPHGLFDFLTPRMETGEGIGEVEFAVVRRGNTDEAASVTLKIIDMTAEYGVDYVVRIPGLIFDRELEANPDSQLLYAEGVYTIGDDTASLASGDFGVGEAAPAAASESEPSDNGADDADSAPASGAGDEIFDELGDRELAPTSEGTDLRSARTALTGAASDNTIWREADEAEVAVLAEAYGELYDELEGVECELTFAPGEYRKTIKFVSLDDNVSEDEEQALFVLCNPKNAAVSDNPTGFMNIVDDEEPEELTFGFTSDVVTVDEGSFKAELTIERLSGLYRYGTVEVSSAEVSAVEGVHYDGFSAELTFVPGQQYQKIDIPIKSHPSLEDAEFLVYIGDYQDCASVVIRSNTVIGQPGDEDGDDAAVRSTLLRGAATDSLLGATNNAANRNAAVNLWTRKETVRPNGVLCGTSNNGFSSKDGWNYVWMELNNRYNATATDTLNVDLSMVGKIKTKSQEFWDGTYWKSGFWFWQKSGYYSDMRTSIYLGNSEKVLERGKYNAKEHTITLNDTDRKAGSIRYQVTTNGNTKHAYSGFSRDIELYYLPIEIRIGAYEDDAMIQRKIYTSPTSYEKDGSAFLAGKLKFQGESADMTSKFFYHNDVVSFNETDRTETDGTYLWGIKFETIGGSTSKFRYYEGTSFSISDLYTGKLKDINGSPIANMATQSDTISGETFPCYRVYPVYRQKTAFTTIKIDENKSKFATGTFENEVTFQTGILDKIQIDIAGNGDWAVSGFDLAYANRNKYAVSPDWLEREFCKKEALSTAHSVYKNHSPAYRNNSGWTRSLVNADVSIPGKYLFSPVKTDNILTALYQKPEITVAVNPRAGSPTDQSKGFVAYADAATPAKYTNTTSNSLLQGSEIKISPYKVGETYQLIGAFDDPAETGYKFQWQDFTGDIDRDGLLTDKEIKALGKSYEQISKGVYAGDIFNFVPTVTGSPILYYHIVPKSQNETGTGNPLAGTVLLSSCTVLNNTKLKSSFTEIPIAGAVISAGGFSAVTDADGKWAIRSDSFATGEVYTATLAYEGRTYTGDVLTNRECNFVVDEYNTFDVHSFNAYCVTNDSEYENVEDWQNHGLSVNGISNEDKRHLYTFKIDELIPTTATVGHVEVNRYSSAGILKKTYTAIYNDKSKVFEVKDPTLLEQYKSNPKAYNYSFNPATEGVAGGDYLTIRVYDQYGVGYIEHNVGFIFKPKLSVLNIVNSFKSPLNPVVDFIGKVDMLFDLGITAKMNDLDNTLSDVVEDKLSVTTDQDARTISFGWNKDFKKSYDSSKKKDGKKDPDSSEAPKSAAEAVKEEAQKLEMVSDAPGNGSAEKDAAAKNAAAETAKQAVDKNGKENEKSSKITADMKVNLSVALELVMGYDKATNRYYFKDFVVTGVVKGAAGSTYEYTTPIGIVIFVKGDLSGDITAMMAVEPYYQNPAEPDYLYMDESGTIDLTKMGNSDVNRQLNIYGKLMIRPKVTLTVGAAALSDSIASVSLNGAADFDMVFTTAGDGAGKVLLTADLTLSILNGMVTKKWAISKKEYNMFSINGGSLRRLMRTNGDYRYDVITDEDMSENPYPAERSGWGESRRLLFSTGAEAYHEVSLQSGVYPHAYPQIFMLREGDEDDYTGATSEQLLLFLDRDSEKVCLMYSIYQDSGDGRGYTWTQPAPVDPDTAGDDTPQAEDLGDRLLITWSSQARISSDDPVDKLNSRNIKSVFFDKRTKTFSDVQYVTKTTDADKTADDYASASYRKADDGSELLMVTYIKTEYKQTGEELAVGDLLDAYSTIAYRFYDFNEGKWADTYSAAAEAALRQTLPSDDAFAQFKQNWYGQGFVDLSRYVTVDETNLLIPADSETLQAFAGQWSRKPLDSEISIAALGTDPKVVEHETINCGKYAVSAYLVDLDKNLSTIDDRDIFLQLYDFEKDTFYPAMRLTNDACSQSYLEFMKAPDGVNLYYISNGNIVQQSISGIVDNLIEANVGGTDVLLQNKCYEVYSGETLIIESEEDHPYTEFIANTDGNNVYLTWTESGISTADGIDINSSEATQPENYFAERQIYMAMQTFTAGKYTYTDESGNPVTYSDSVDWNTKPDVNGEVGKVRAGDPIVLKTYESKWTKPVRMTSEQGANFSDIDCVRISDGVLRIVCLKGYSEITDIGGERIPAENADNRSLISTDYDLDVEKYTIRIDNAADVEAGMEETPIQVTVKNESLLTMNDVCVSLQMSQNGEQSYVGDAVIDEIIGGGSAAVRINWNVPETLDGVSLTAAVNHGGMEFESVSEDFRYDGLIEITDVSCELLARNTAEFTVLVRNTGSENALDERVYVNCGGVVSKSEPFDLVSGGTMIVTVTAEIPEAAFTQSRTETTITETAPLKVYTTGSIVDQEVVRSADSSLEAQLNGVSGLLGSDGKVYSDSLQLAVGGLLTLRANSGEDVVNRPLLSVESEDESVVSVVNGVLTGETAGRAKLKVELYPNVDTYVTEDSGSMRTTDSYKTLPSSLVRTMEITALVGAGSADHSSDRDDGYTPPNSAAVTAPVSGSGASLPVNATVSGTTATIQAPGEADLSKAIDEGAKAGGITIDVSTLGKDITTVSIPAETVKTIEKANHGSSDSAVGLTVKLADGSVTFDAKALAAIVEQMKGSDLKLSFDSITEGSLNSAQQSAAKNMDVQAVYDAYLTSNGVRIGDFRDGEATVSVPYTLGADQTASGLVVWYIADNGEKVEMSATYANRTESWLVTHFSNYVVAYDEARVVSCPRDKTCPISAFTDADPNAWYHDGLHYVLEHGIMSGMDGGLFAPDGTTTRAQIATILWNMEGQQSAGRTMDYADVSDDGWYAPAVRWANAQGLMSGYGDGRFGPDDPVTREQLVTILYRYAKLKGMDVSGVAGTDMLRYNDASTVSDWAMAAIEWAVSSGLVSGKTATTLNPQETATRAEIATIIMRYGKKS